MMIRFFQHFSHFEYGGSRFLRNYGKKHMLQGAKKNKNIYLNSIRYGRRETYKVTLSLCLGKNNRKGTGN